MPTFLANGGPVLWLILLASAVALAVFIERVLHLHRAQINSTEFLNGVRNVLKRDNAVEAVSICDATPGPVARLVKVAVLNRDFGRERVREAIEEAGLKVIISDLRTLDGEEMGYLGARLMLQQDPRPTAIFAADDPAGRGVYRAARDHDLNVPEDLTVAGFNDTPDAAALHPPLTTVRVFTEELGRQAGELLFQQLEHPDIATHSVVLPTQLIRRESSAPPIRPALTTRKHKTKSRSTNSR